VLYASPEHLSESFGLDRQIINKRFEND